MCDVIVDWAFIRSDYDPLWQARRGLYSYCHPESLEILYIGKVDSKTVRQRWVLSGKPQFWNYIEKEYRIGHIAILVGEIVLGTSRRLSIELLEDIESLLIAVLQPRGNIQSKKSRVSRSGLVVECVGDWPLEEASTFRDSP